MPLILRLLSLFALGVATSSVSAETLEITGELMTSTCSVGSTGGTITVPMGKVDLASVNASTRAGQKNFTIALDCSGSGASQDLGVRFGGMPGCREMHAAQRPRCSGPPMAMRCRYATQARTT
jgi:type 1 fimbria pilin